MWDSTVRKYKNVPKNGWETVKFSSKHREEEGRNNRRNCALANRHDNGIWTARGLLGEKAPWCLWEAEGEGNEQGEQTDGSADLTLGTETQQRAGRGQGVAEEQGTHSQLTQQGLWMEDCWLAPSHQNGQVLESLRMLSPLAGGFPDSVQPWPKAVVGIPQFSSDWHFPDD